GTVTATPTLTITSGLLSGEAVSATGTATFNSKDVLTANLVTVNSVTLADGVTGLATNYALGTGQTVAASIIPATLDIVANDDTVDYSGNPYSGGNGVVYVGFVNGETVAILDGMLTYGGSSQGAVDSGEYIISPSGQTGDNYAVTYVDGMLTIQSLPFTPVLPDPNVSSSNNNTGITDPTPQSDVVSGGDNGANQNSGSFESGSNGQTIISGVTGTGGETGTGGTDTGTGGTNTGTGGTDTGTGGTDTGTGGTDTGTGGTDTGTGGTDTGTGGTDTGGGSTDTGSNTGNTGESAAADGITVKMVAPSTPQTTGVVTVTVSTQLLNSGSSFTIPLPAQVKGVMTANMGSELVTLDGGAALPKWIRYDAQSKSFEVNQPPAGALPITVQVSVGDMNWKVVISKK
ncbi:MAG: hypothetical protein JZU70_08815, partial [Chlorobium sp.]|nr:hypothetical protein [Chlorobium sp.]